MTATIIMSKMFLIASLMCLVFSSSVAANQAGINFSEDSIGILGDYERTIGSWEFGSDAQAQFSNERSLIANLSVQHNFNEAVGIKPFVSYNRDTVGNVLDAGGVLNFSVFELDIAAGASFRGADPVSGGLEERYDGDDQKGYGAC